MFVETYQISRESTERLLKELYRPDRDKIIQNNHRLEKRRVRMHISKSSDGAKVHFDDLDLSFLNHVAEKICYSKNILSTLKESVQIDWESNDANTQFVLGQSSSLAA